VAKKRRSWDEDLSEDSFDSYRPASIRSLVIGGLITIVVIAALILAASWVLNQPGMENVGIPGLQ
jgi:hypothetical protein